MICSNLISKKEPLMKPVTNPNTGRILKPGSKLYNQLIRQQEGLETHFKGLYSFGGSEHELWCMIIMRVDLSLLTSLSLVNKFTRKYIHTKYPLEKWLDYIVKKTRKRKWKKNPWLSAPFSYFSMREKWVEGPRRTRKEFLSKFFPGYETMNDNMRLCTFKYLLRHLLIENTFYPFHPSMTIDEGNLSDCIFSFHNKRIFFRGSTRKHYKEPVLDNATIIDKRSPRYELSCYIKTHKYTEGKPVYLWVSSDTRSYVDVTEYFEDVW